jgi:hypothetical protein
MAWKLVLAVLWEPMLILPSALEKVEVWLAVWVLMWLAWEQPMAAPQ